jgi:hypothetical protein
MPLAAPISSLDGSRRQKQTASPMTGCALFRRIVRLPLHRVRVCLGQMEARIMALIVL